MKIDFTTIANEKITLCHDNKNQSLHIILAETPKPSSSHSSTRWPDVKRVFEMTPGQVSNSAEFASQFPIRRIRASYPTETRANRRVDTSRSGRRSSPSERSPAGLLPPEELPPIAFSESFPSLGFTESADRPPSPPSNAAGPPPGLTIVAGVGLPLAVDESFIPGIGSQAVVAGSPASNIVTQPFASSFTVDAPAGVQSITYALTLSSNGVDSGLIELG